MSASEAAWPTLVPVTRVVACEKCRRPIELACSGLIGTVIYETFNEFLCPSCGGRNYARTPGNIVSAHVTTLSNSA